MGVGGRGLVREGFWELVRLMRVRSGGEAGCLSRHMALVCVGLGACRAHVLFTYVYGLGQGWSCGPAGE
jgi:hypothetical protein